MTVHQVSIDALSPLALARTIALRDWLINEARFDGDDDVVNEAFAEKLLNAGLPLDRITSAIPTLHAQRAGIGKFWEKDEPVRTTNMQWENRHLYDSSPFARAHETGEWVEFRLSEIDDSEFGIVPDLREKGITHYVCIPIKFLDGALGGLTFATKQPSGFTPEDLAMLKLIEPPISMLLDFKRGRILLDETLRMYVGEEPHRRILSGEVRLGEVMRIRSAIMFTDMRGFTERSSTMSAEETVELLNCYYDCIVPSVEETGGEVLKFIGDGVLAIFRAEEGAETDAAERAFQAGEAILNAVNRHGLNAEDPRKRFDVKVALHFGEVAYGNIGSGARLDYTVIGRGVNITSRVADLCGRLQRRMLVTEPFAELLPDRKFLPVGTHKLRGVAEPQAIREPL